MLQHTEEKLERLIGKGAETHLDQLQRGLEKESLRVDDNGLLAQTPHPKALGSALAHPSITTDYSEALLEFVTPVHTDPEALLQELYDIHHYTYQHLDGEKLWVNSMPCIVESEQKIPIARYGTSNVAKMKEAYRRGLGHRYGRLMQTIAGIHFNFSLPDRFWEDYLETDNEHELQTQRSDQYFGLIRNFHRLSWLGCYLFGASPAICKSFLQGRQHALNDFDLHSLYAPNATSLRLSGLGYSNNTQATINIGYNGVDDFVKSLKHAIQTVNPNYEKFGIKVNGKYQQLNANRLQIENEFYSVIRPKRVTASGESPSNALRQRGVQYVEVRSLDLNPFDPIGINKACIHFFDTLLMYCLLSDSPRIDDREWAMTADNRNRVVMHGRKPGLNLQIGGTEKPFSELALLVLEQMRPIAELLATQTRDRGYVDSLDRQVEKIHDPAFTPSAQIITRMQENKISFYEFAMGMAEQHETLFRQSPQNTETHRDLAHQAERSLNQQAEIEARDVIDFDTFLADYFFRQNHQPPCCGGQC